MIFDHVWYCMFILPYVLPCRSYIQAVTHPSSYTSKQATHNLSPVNFTTWHQWYIHIMSVSPKENGYTTDDGSVQKSPSNDGSGDQSIESAEDFVDTRCGYTQSCKPSCLQVCSNPKVYLLVISLCSIIQGRSILTSMSNTTLVKFLKGLLWHCMSYHCNITIWCNWDWLIRISVASMCNTC